MTGKKCQMEHVAFEEELDLKHAHSLKSARLRMYPINCTSFTIYLYFIHSTIPPPWPTFLSGDYDHKEMIYRVLVHSYITLNNSPSIFSAN